MPPIHLNATPLPTGTPLSIDDGDLPSLKIIKADANVAYNRCLLFEQVAKPEQLKYARALGYFIRQFQSNTTALKTLAENIIACNDSDALLRLGTLYSNHVLRLFKKSKGRTPASSDHPSRPSFEALRKSIETRLDEGPTNHREAKQFALYRDNYRCILTGMCDDRYAELHDHAGPAGDTECAHIIPSSIFSGVSDLDSTNQKRTDTVAVLTISKSFGYDVTNILGDNVDSLCNVMTLYHGIHNAFDGLKLWFEATDNPNEYKIQYSQVYANNPIFGMIPDIVTLSTETALPLPSKALLELHAVCCKVARLSGTAEYIEKYEREEEEICVLSNDGSSKELLDSVLYSRLASFIGVEV